MNDDIIKYNDPEFDKELEKIILDELNQYTIEDIIQYECLEDVKK